MLIFRSEEHLERWLERGNPKGETLTLPQQWDLAKKWFKGRHLPGWEPRTAAQAEEVFHEVDLSSSFWRFD